MRSSKGLLGLAGSMVVLWGVLLGAVALPALAAAPEEPKTEKATLVTATTATLHGELDPLKEAPAGYVVGSDFTYNTNGTCEPGNATAPSTEVEKVKELKVSEPISGLEPNQNYMFCVVANHLEGETPEATSGMALSFKTLPAPPAVESEGASGVLAHEATLEAQVNPNNEETSYTFEYSTSESAGNLTGTVTKLKDTTALSGYGNQTASVSTGAILTQVTTYYYRVVAENAQSEKEKKPVALAVQSFKTGLEAPTATNPPAPIAATTATLHGALNPKEPGESGHYEFIYSKSATECTGPEQKVAPEPAGTVTGAEGQAVEAPITGLERGQLYTFCLLVKNAAEEPSPASAPVTFRTLSEPPEVTPESTSATEVTSSSAELNAQINPGGGATTYHFEYDTTPYKEGEAAHGTSTPESGSIGSDNNPHPATTAIEDLEPGTVYHYRVVVHNAAGGTGGSTVDGPDATFTTQTGATGSALIDNRAWEQVSPVNKHGARIDAIPTEEGGQIQAAVDGSAMTYVADGSTEAQPEGNPSLADSQVMSVRNPGGGWRSRDIATPKAGEPSGVPAFHLSEYYAFTPDLSEGIVEPWRGIAPQLAANAKENTVFIRKGLREPAGAAYEALVNDENTPLGTRYGETQEVEYVVASSNLEHVILSSQQLPLTSAYPSGGFYEWTAGVLTPVTVLNGQLIGDGLASIGHQGYNVRNAVSEDGNHVFWGIRAIQDGPNAGNLYMREVSQEHTVRLDLPNQGVALPTAEPEPVFTDATPNGEHVYFKDDQALTANAVQGANSLYEYNAEAPPGERLTDLTPGTGVAGEMIGASQNGEYVYFASDGKLAAGAQAGEPNLYIEHTEAGERSISLVAVLSNADGHDWAEGPYPNGDVLSYLTSRSSPDGRYLAFMSDRGLTGYDNEDVDEQPTKSEEAEGVSAGTKVKRYDEEVFLYHAPENLATESGTLTCASCNPTGARPHGVLDQREAGEGEGLLVDRPAIWNGSWLAGSVPGWTPRYQEHTDYQSRYLSDSGRLFFTAAGSLVAQDTNGKEDVYEYEPEGVGPAEGTACGPAFVGGSVVYRSPHGFEVEGRKGEEPAGCVGLISSGKSDKESAFLDAGENGEDAFFLTAAPLASTDIDAADDVYDAHVCSAAAPCATASTVLPPCTTEASCKAAPASQPAIFGAPASSTFSGAGNVTPTTIAPKKTTKKAVKCKRGFAKNKKGKCVRKKSKKKARRASNDRRVK